MNPTMNTNGRQRKTLAAQIDRLDTMLDGLAENLNDAVAQAVRDAVAMAVQEAVRAVLTEAMSNPVLIAKLRAAAPVAQLANTDETPSLGQRLVSGWRWLSARCHAAWQLLRAANGTGPMLVAQIGTLALVQAQRVIMQARECCRPLWRIKYQLVAALAVAGALGVAGFFAGPILASASSAVCGFVVTLTLQTSLWLRRRLIDALPAPRHFAVLQE
jgi:hypothetical protein